LDRGYDIGRLALRDRAFAWLVTGPAGRLAAFVADLGAALLRAAVNRARRDH
jgi:hypothetical protein